MRTTLVATAAVLGLNAADANVASVRLVGNLPAKGTTYQLISGSVSGLCGQPSDYKAVVLLSANNGQTWWDKTHSQYINAAPGRGWTQAETGQKQNAGMVVQTDWTFSSIVGAWESVPQDDDADLFRFYILPNDFPLNYPDYIIEGVALPWGKLEACAIQSYEYNRATGQVSVPAPNVQGLDLCNGLCQALIPSPNATAPEATPSPAVQGDSGAASVALGLGAVLAFVMTLVASLA